VYFDADKAFLENMVAERKIELESKCIALLLSYSYNYLGPEVAYEVRLYGAIQIRLLLLLL